VTEPGEQVLQSIEVILREVGNLKRIGEDFSKQDAGHLSIATTHTQARYVLPEPITLLRRRYPKVNVTLHQGTPEQVAQMLIEERADIGLATESLASFDQLVTLPCYSWQHMMVVPASHPLAAVERPTLEQLAAEPLVSYHPSFTGRTRIDAAFARARLKPEIVLEAIDSDVIKTYVRSGLGVGLVAEMAMRDEPAAGDLVARPVGYLFGDNTSRVAFKRGAYLRSFVYTLAELLSERLTRALIKKAMTGGPDASDDDPAL
jgi:LysR family cys regulon transcriptional activator